MSATVQRRGNSHRTFIVTGLLLSSLLFVAWQQRGYRYITPEEGPGYYLGIVGGSMMLALLLYPLRKRKRSLAWIGSVRTWFRVHQILGVLGPTLIILHSNFGLGSINGEVALISMLIVASSGLVGRYFYGRSHHGLLSQQAALKALVDERNVQKLALASVFESTPTLAERWDALHIKPVPMDRGVLAALWIAWRQGMEGHRLQRELTRGLRDMERSGAVRVAEKQLHTYTRLVLKVAQFHLYERLLSLWHVLHMPLFVLLIITATFHVLAVHMY